jgi:hypothetical protein
MTHDYCDMCGELLTATNKIPSIKQSQNVGSEKVLDLVITNSLGHRLHVKDICNDCHKTLNNEQ